VAGFIAVYLTPPKEIASPSTPLQTEREIAAQIIEKPSEGEEVKKEAETPVIAPTNIQRTVAKAQPKKVEPACTKAEEPTAHTEKLMAQEVAPTDPVQEHVVLSHKALFQQRLQEFPLVVV
jgi:hypothetical protein